MMKKYDQNSLVIYISFLILIILFLFETSFAFTSIV